MPNRSWRAAIVLMALCALATAWFPLLSIASLPSQNYNEGWNAYRQLMALQNVPLYGARPGLWAVNYPFLSFHIIALLGGAKGNLVLAGRIVCFASLVIMCGLAGAIVRRVTASRAGAVFAALALFVWLGAFNGDGRALDDPDLLSAALGVFGLYAYMRAPERLAVAALAFTLSLFIKHDLIGFPLSVAVHLLAARRWRGLAVFAAAGAGGSALLLALSYYLDGPYFFAAFLQERAYGVANLRAETLHYLLHFIVPLTIGAVILRQARALAWRRFLLILLLVTNLLSIGFAGGDGVAADIFYPALIADVLACAVALCWLERQGGRRFSVALYAAMFAAAVMVPFQFATDMASWHRLPEKTAAARAAIGILQTAPGPAICEDPLLCYEAGKPLDYDAYYVRDQILTGRLHDADVVAMLRVHHYAAIQISGAADEDTRFTSAFQRALLAYYRPVLVSRFGSVFLP